MRRTIASRRVARLSVEHLEDRTAPAVGIGIYNPATDGFALRNTPTAGTADAATFKFDTTGTVPVAGDWNGDGKQDFGLFDPATATWSLRYGAETGPANAGTFQFGRVGTLPVVGDWNGDGRSDIGTFDPKTATWTLRYGASPGIANAGVFQYGRKGELPVVGDWNGDGRDGVGTFNPGKTTWTLRQTASPGAADAGSFNFGTRGGIPVVGDWNGDGRDGVGTFKQGSSQWTLRQTANAGPADAGTFAYGAKSGLPITGDWSGPALPSNSLAVVQLKPIDLNLLGLEVQTSPITLTVSTERGDGKLLGNLLTTVSSLVDLNSASNALNSVLGSTVDLLNSAGMAVSGVTGGSLTTATAADAQVLELWVAPVHLDLLGAKVDTSPIRVTLTAHAGDGLVLGNAVTELMNLFNPPLPDRLDVDLLNSKLEQLLTDLNGQTQGIPSAPVPPVQLSDGQILNVTVPPLDLNLLGLGLQTSPITVNATAQTGDGLLLGNVLTSALQTLGATPQNLADLNNNVNALLAKVVGVLNASDISLAPALLSALPPALQTLTSPTLTAPAAGATAPVLDLMIASTDGSSPPVDVNLLGLNITTSDIDAHLTATTGNGLVLGNLLYNLANLADPGTGSGLLGLLNALGAGNFGYTGTPTDGVATPAANAPQQLLQINLKPLDINLLGLRVQSDPITVTLSTQDGDGKLLGNLLEGITSLINTDAVSRALNNVLATTVDLVNSLQLGVSGVGGGSLGTLPDGVAAGTITPVLDLFVAPVHLDLLGLVATTSPIHLTITAEAGDGLVLGNVVTDLANLFNPPIQPLSIDVLNQKLAALLDELNQQIPGITPAPTPPVNLGSGQFLNLTVAPIDLNLLGLVLQTSPITVNAFSQQGNGLLLGNIVTTALNTLDATPENLTGLNQNLNALLAKVVGVLNASHLTLSPGVLGSLPTVLQTLASPLLLAPAPGASTPVLDLAITSPTSGGPPVDVNLLGLQVTTSDIRASLSAVTGDGNLLGNLVYNVANLLNPGNSLSLLTLLTQLSRLGL
jgi:hypothetical protein